MTNKYASILREISLKCGEYSGKTLAVFTSGGDCQGMNAALRGIVRTGLYLGCSVYFIKEGYQGMVDGAEYIVPAKWADVSGIAQYGGTIIGSARCKDFREKKGRLKAAKNLIDKNICNLVVIGGDGSLTGANLFRSEWPDLVKELLATKEITKSQSEVCKHLNMVGLVGSIDNDFCGTDMTIGTDSALHRIIEACDAISSTAQSHQRCFILEVMGRHCGYLALTTAIACEAEAVFIPEDPPPEGWQNDLCTLLNRSRTLGHRVNIIIMAEGAVDQENNPITGEQVKQLISDKLKIDTRVTVLGHVQRGGAPSAYDRLLGLRMGTKAVQTLMEMSKTENQPSSVVILRGNRILTAPLMSCVNMTMQVTKAMLEKRYDMAMTLRGKSFKSNVLHFKDICKISASETADTNSLILGIVNVGAPCCGINACIRSFVRVGINLGYCIKGIRGGLRGLFNKTASNFHWDDVKGIAASGGSIIGARRATAARLGLDKIAEGIRDLKLSGLLIIGGFEAFLSLEQMYEGRKDHPELRIPMVVVPASISNNIPGTEFSLGCDTSLNMITQMIEVIKQSAAGRTQRVFLVEVMGGYCGYLSCFAALAAGADRCYIYESSINLNSLCLDVEIMKTKLSTICRRGIIVRNEKANANYTTDFLHRLYESEANGLYECRSVILGHTQQGDLASPFDRSMGTKMGTKSLNWLHDCLTNSAKNPGDAVVLGCVEQSLNFTPVRMMKNSYLPELRIVKEPWWLHLKQLIEIMADPVGPDIYYSHG